MDRLNHRLILNSTPDWLKNHHSQHKMRAMTSKIGKTIAERLKELGKTQGWLAEEVGVSVNAVSKWTKEGKIGRENVAAVATALNLTTDQLLGGSALTDATPSDSTTLERLDPDEKRILELYRTATKDGRLMILGAATVAPKDESLLARRPH